MAQIFGNFVEADKGQAQLLMRFSPASLPIDQNWQNNGLSADFAAEYWTSFLPSDGPLSSQKQAETKDAISYILNELLENAMKSAYDAGCHVITASMHVSDDALRLYVKNSFKTENISKFQKFIRCLLTEDPHDLYFCQLAKNTQDQTDTISNLGFLTILCNYDADLAWKFERKQTTSGTATVTTMAALSMESEDSE